MKVTPELITPIRAAEILARSVGQRQRAIDRDRVNVMAVTMKKGGWRLTHQPIALDAHGVCYDGQHRLSAIVVADTPVTVLMAYDGDADTFDVIDTGRGRTPGNIFHIAGYGDSNTFAAAIRQLLVYDALKGTVRRPDPGLRSSFTSSDLLAVAASDRGDSLASHIQDAQRISSALNRIGGRTWFMPALLLIEESGASEALRASFADELERGAMLRADSPVLALRRWLVTGDTGFSRVRADLRSFVGICSVLKTWNLWVEGRSVQAFSFKVGIEKAPIPVASRAAA